MKRARIKVHGRVQGVGFRWTLRREAGRLGVAGSVANCPDGSLEAVFEGPPDAVEEMLALCREGPSGARVEDVEESEEETEGATGFDVR